MRTMTPAVVLSVTWLVLLATGQTRLHAQEPPSPPKLEFTGPENGWPPRVKGATDVRIVPWEETPGSLTDELEARLRQIASRDRRVKRELGRRFSYISTDEIEQGKGLRRGPASRLAVRVTFFSHSRNTAVEVTMRGDEVESVARRPEDQPPEGADEVTAAVGLARREPRLRGKLQGLAGTGILAWPNTGEPGYGHRVLYVTFGREDADLPSYFALVDLTDRRVLAAGPITA